MKFQIKTDGPHTGEHCIIWDETEPNDELVFEGLDWSLSRLSFINECLEEFSYTNKRRLWLYYKGLKYAHYMSGKFNSKLNRSIIHPKPDLLWAQMIVSVFNVMRSRGDDTAELHLTTREVFHDLLSPAESILRRSCKESIVDDMINELHTIPW